MDRDTLKNDIKQWMIAELRLTRNADEIGDDTPLFGAGGLGIDSLDALQLVMSAEEKWGVKVPMDASPAETRRILASVNTLTDHVMATQTK